jgi:hypothetical protein
VPPGGGPDAAALPNPVRSGAGPQIVPNADRCPATRRRARKARACLSPGLTTCQPIA